jgi:hypothetical protein
MVPDFCADDISLAAKKQHCRQNQSVFFCMSSVGTLYQGIFVLSFKLF